jgi:excisionase family DNA binding protein
MNQQSPATPRFVTVSEFAECLRVSTKTIERGIASGLFVATRVRGAVRLNLDRNLARVEPREPGLGRQRLRSAASTS